MSEVYLYKIISINATHLIILEDDVILCYKNSTSLIRKKISNRILNKLIYHVYKIDSIKRSLLITGEITDKDNFIKRFLNSIYINVTSDNLVLLYKYEIKDRKE